MNLVTTRLIISINIQQNKKISKNQSSKVMESCNNYRKKEVKKKVKTRQ